MYLFSITRNDRAVIYDLKYKIGVLEFENIWLGLAGSVSMLGIYTSSKYLCSLSASLPIWIQSTNA